MRIGFQRCAPEPTMPQPPRPRESVEPNDAPPRLLTVAEACERFRLSRRFLEAAARRGDLRAARFGRAVRIDVADLRAFLDAAKGAR